MLGTAPLAVLLAPYAASAATLNVCATCTYTTIGAGVTAAVAGDTVLVAPGTYTDTVALNKALTITGSGGSGATIWNGGAGNEVIGITGNGAVTLEGFTIRPRVGSRRAPTRTPSR